MLLFLVGAHERTGLAVGRLDSEAVLVETLVLVALGRGAVLEWHQSLQFLVEGGCGVPRGLANACRMRHAYVGGLPVEHGPIPPGDYDTSVEQVHATVGQYIVGLHTEHLHRLLHDKLSAGSDDAFGQLQQSLQLSQFVAVADFVQLVVVGGVDILEQAQSLLHIGVVGVASGSVLEDLLQQQHVAG